MTDETPTTPETPAEEPVYIAAAAVGDEQGILAEGALAVQGNMALLMARFADPAAAGEAYEGLREAEAEKELKIDGVLVVDAGEDGKINVRKMTDHRTKRGTVWGAVAGGALAIIFPPSIIAGAIAGGVIGAAAGKVGHTVTKGKVADELAGVITPGTSGILAVFQLEDLEEVKAAIPEATEVKAVPVDDETAAAVTAAAKAADEAPAS